MIYVDTSVALAALLSEDRYPSARFWSQPLVASRLLTYELWVRLHARGLTGSHGEAVGQLLAHIALLELIDPVLERARDPFPVHVRTLDALHLASVAFLRSQGADVSLATYDGRMRACAQAMEIPLHEP